MALTDYSIDTTGTPQDVARKQALADALMKQGMDSTPAAGGKGGGWMTALNRGLAGAMGGYQRGAAANEETQGRDSVRQQLAAALGADGKVDPQAYIQAASNPWATPGQIGAVGKVADWQHTAERDKVGDQHWGASFGLQKNADARGAAAEARAAKEFENTPDQYIPNPKAGEPGQPNFLDQYAQAKAAAEASTPGALKTLTPGGEIYHVDQDGKIVVDHKNDKTINGDTLLDSDTIGALAQQARAGDTSVFANLGRGAQGAENIVKLRKEIVRQNTEAGVTGSEQALRNAEMSGVKAGQRTIGTKGANIEMAATEFNQVLPVVQAASQAVKRTDYPDLNKIIMAGEAKTGDPNVVKFGGGVNTLINLYARAISPTGTPTVSDKDHAREILSASWSSGQFDAAVGMMQQEIKAALSSPEKVRDEMRSRFLKGQGAAPVGYPAPGASDVPAPAATSSGFKDGDIARNPQTGQSLIRKNGKWEPMS